MAAPPDWGRTQEYRISNRGMSNIEYRMTSDEVPEAFDIRNSVLDIRYSDGRCEATRGPRGGGDPLVAAPPDWGRTQEYRISNRGISNIEHY